MTDSYRKRDNCRLCGTYSPDLVLHLAPTPIADDYVSAGRVDEAQELFPLDLYQCRACGHVQLLDVVNPELLFGNYTYRTSVSLGLVEHFRSYAEGLMQMVRPSADMLAVDIGSNDGTLLRLLKERGMRVLGIDPAREIAAEATEAGIKTLPTFFTSALARELRIELGPADIVTANNVFAHADELGDIADGVSELLADNGVLVFEVSYLVDIVQGDLFDTVYHEHLCYHAVKPLDRFFASHRMQLFDIQRSGSKGGSLRGFAQRAGGPRPVASSVGAHIELEDQLGIDGARPLTELGRRLEENKAKLLGMLQSLKAEGKVVAGYGASASVTTLLYYFGLGQILDFIVDDNPRKHGTFSPGDHIPVLPSDAIYEQRADYVVILAWAYAEPIIKKHQRFLDRGGRFVLPMPKVRMV